MPRAPNLEDWVHMRGVKQARNPCMRNETSNGYMAAGLWQLMGILPSNSMWSSVKDCQAKLTTYRELHCETDRRFYSSIGPVNLTAQVLQLQTPTGKKAL